MRSPSSMMVQVIAKDAMAVAPYFPFGVEVILPVERIKPDSVMLRDLDDEKVQDMAKSFQSVGQKQAINVRPRDAQGYFFLVTFGEHRTAAATLLYAAGVPVKGLPLGTIRAVVERVDELDALELKITENTHRNEFSDPYRVGEQLSKDLHERYGGNVNALSEKLGKPPSWIQDRTRVYLRLAPSLRPLIGKPKGLSAANAINLARIDDQNIQMQLADTIITSKSGANLMRGQNFGRGGGKGGMNEGWVVPQKRIRAECRCAGCGNLHYKPALDIVLEPTIEVASSG